MPAARKEHRCTLCDQTIPKGPEYISKRITPWDHADNETFFQYKAHLACDLVWGKIAQDYDYEFPDDSGWWREQMEQSGYRMEPGQGPIKTPEEVA